MEENINNLLPDAEAVTNEEAIAAGKEILSEFAEAFRELAK